MISVQDIAKTGYTVDKVLAALAIMMKMNFDVRYPFANHFRQWFYQRRMVLFFRKEKRIPRRVAGTIGLASLRNHRPCRTPASNA
jgi:hypothetical protein